VEMYRGVEVVEGGDEWDEWEPSPEVVLQRCAHVLGIMDGAQGILAVRSECHCV